MEELKNGQIQDGNGNNETGNQGNPPEDNPGVVERFIKRTKKVIVTVKTNPVGKVVIGITKGLALVVGGKAIYDKGFKKGAASVQPTVVTITEGEVHEEEDVPEEEPAEMAEEAAVDNQEE